MSFDTPTGARPSKSTLRDVTRVLNALDRIADRLGDEWDNYEYDALSSARSAIAQWAFEREDTA